MRSVRLLAALLLVVCFIFSVANGESSEENNDDSSVKITPKIVFPRRRLFRKRIHAVHDGDAEGNGNVTTSVSMSVSRSVSDNANAQIEIHTKSEKPLPKFFKSQRPRIKFVKPDTQYIKSQRPLPNYLKTESTTLKQTTETQPQHVEAEPELELKTETELEPELKSETESKPAPKPETSTPRPKFVMPGRPFLKFPKLQIKSTTPKSIEPEPNKAETEKPKPNYFKSNRTFSKFVKPASATMKTKSAESRSAEQNLPPAEHKLQSAKYKSVEQNTHSTEKKSPFAVQKSRSAEQKSRSEEQRVTESKEPLKPKLTFFRSKRPIPNFLKPKPQSPALQLQSQSRSVEQDEVTPPKFAKPSIRPFPKFMKSDRFLSKFTKSDRVLQVSSEAETEFAEVEPIEPQTTTSKFLKFPKPRPSFFKNKPWNAKSASVEQSTESAMTTPKSKPSFFKSKPWNTKSQSVEQQSETETTTSKSRPSFFKSKPWNAKSQSVEQQSEPETTTSKSRPSFFKSKPWNAKSQSVEQQTETETTTPKNRPSFFNPKPWNSKFKRTSVEVESTTETSTTTLTPLKPRLNLFKRFQDRPKLTQTKYHSANNNNENEIDIIPTMTPTIGKTTDETLNETPSSSFRPKLRPSFGRAPTNRPIVKSTLKKLFRPTLRTTATTNYEEVISEDEAVPDIESTTSTTPAAPLITTTPAAEEISSPQRTGTQQTTNTISPTPDTTFNAAASQPTEVTSASSAEPHSSVETRTNLKNKNMIIIPVPPSQRKPYHPVIMQVTKTPAVSSTAKPQTKVITYKLNKMFVPMGIYGKVLPKSEINGTDTEAGHSQEQGQGLHLQETADLISSTQRPITNNHNTLFPSSTISPSIRHKGSSEEQLLASGDNSGEYSAASLRPAIPVSESDSVFASQEWRPAFSPEQRQESKNRNKNKNTNSREQGGKQFFDASQVDLTNNYKPDISSISLTTKRPNIAEISLTTTEVPAYFGTSLGQGPNGNRRENYKNENSMFQMGPPRPFDKNANRPSSLMDSIKNVAASAASSIPGIIHGGLTSLSQLSQPFEDSFFGSTQSSPVKSNPGNGYGGAGGNGGGVTLGAPDDETLEYFRKRPHLLSKGNKPNFHSGFKPVTAPAHFAKAYYASTTTSSPSKPEPTYSHPSSTTARPSYEPPTYESHKPSLLTRSPKNVQEWKDSYVDQLLESSNKYKYAATASPTETDILKSHWREMSQKYTKNELDDATNRIYSLMGSSSAPSLDELLYMKPPTGQWSRSSSSAFHDLLKMFRLGVTYGSASSVAPPYEKTIGNPRSRIAVSTGSDLDGWRPIKHGRESAPFLSFNAGISFGTTPTPSSPRPTPLYSGHGGTHYSSSSKPFIPGPSLKNSHSYSKPSGASSLSSYFGSSSLNSYNKGYKSYPSSSTISSYPGSSSISTYPGSSSHSSYPGSSSHSSYPGSSSLSSYSGSSSHSSYPGSSSLSSYSGSSSHSSYPGSSSASSSSLSSSYDSPPPKYSSYRSPTNSPAYSDVYYGSSSLKGGENGEKDEDENGYKPPANLASLYQNDPGLEIIPSSVYYKQKEQGIIQSGEIAGILKPSDMSDETLKAQVPENVANIPQITYPSGKAPQSFQTLDQVNQYFQTSEPTSENQVHFQPPLYRLIQQSLQSQNSQLAYHQQQAMQSHQEGAGTSYKAVPSSSEETPTHSNYYEPQESHQYQSHKHQHNHHQEPDQHHHEQQQVPTHQLQYEPPPQTSSQKTVHHHHHHQSAEVQHHYQPQPNHYQLPQQSQPQHQIQHQHQYEQPQLVQHQPQPQHHQHQHQHLSQQQHGSGAGVAVKATGDSGLGFSDFELPAGVDPDIAALLKAELDKDDIPEEFRKEFAEQEKNKQQKQQQQHQHQEGAASSTSAVIAKPPASLVRTSTTSSISAVSAQSAASAAQRREDAVKTIFHKPIPISPTLLTPEGSKSRAPVRIPATIPRYVLDLARKLKNDKDLQGIVRVTSKKEGGPPIEYLYPVRGR